MKVTLQEKPRVFVISVGNLEIGKVTVFVTKGNEDRQESYLAERFNPADDGSEESLGWYNSMNEAAQEVLAFDYGTTKVNKISERPI